MTVINTNIASLNAQRNLSASQSSLQTSLQRLSSGLRINSAKDDAAGLAISERMSSQIGGLNQAARNANDGISLAQTAEGALSQIGANLQRIRDLAVQSANGSNSSTDRAALNNEASQLISEINRVASATNFNGVNLLDGTFSAQTFQVGANAGDTISISSIASAKSNALGVGASSSYSTTVTGGGNVTTNAFAAGNLTINGYQVGASSTDSVSNVYASASGIAKAAAINAVSGQTGVTATVGATTLAGASNSSATAIASGDIAINGVNIGALAASTTGAGRGAQLAGAINAVTSQTGVTASFDSTTGAIALTAADGRNIDVTTSTNAAAVSANTGLAQTSGATAVATSTLTLKSTSSAGITLADGTGTGLAAANLTSGYNSATVTVGAGVSSLNLSTAAGATSALSTIDSALASINSSRASLGAYQNRFASAVTSVQTNAENLTASRSRIRDADFAQETASLTRSQVLQQAGTAILAQANQLPNGVLSLLRG